MELSILLGDGRGRLCLKRRGTSEGASLYISQQLLGSMSVLSRVIGHSEQKRTNAMLHVRLNAKLLSPRGNLK